MKRPLFVLFASALIAGFAFNLSGQGPEKQRRGFLAGLKEGQAVTLKDVAGRYEITTLDDGPGMLGHKITEFGTDYLVVGDLADVTEIRIPIYSIKSIVRLKVRRK